MRLFPLINVGINNMKFESKFGLGEIVIINNNDELSCESRRIKLPELVAKVVAIIFEMNGHIKYGIEIITKDNFVQHKYAYECELLGDPDFDHDLGKYPNES